MDYLIKDVSITPILVFKFDDNSKKMATTIQIQSNLELEGAPKLNIQVQTLDITNTTTHYGFSSLDKEMTIVLFNYNYNYLITKITM